MGLYANINGTQKIIKNMYYNSDGAKRTLSSMYANVNGSSKIIFNKIYTWAKYDIVTQYSLSYKSGSWLFATGSGLGNFYYVTISSTPDSYYIYYNCIDYIRYNVIHNGDLNGYYMMAPYDTLDNDQNAIRINTYGNGLYAYRISGADSNKKINGEWYDWVIYYDQEASMKSQTSYNFIEYVTSTNKSAYPTDGTQNGYKYTLIS